MQKVLIITYFYPPCNLTASSRSAAWAKYLHGFGYHPVIITRNWDLHIAKLQDMSKATGKTVQVVGDKNHTVYYLPHHPSLKHRLYAKHGFEKFNLLRKTLSFLEFIFQNFFFSVASSRKFYYKAVELIEQDPSISKVIITANPFVLFFVGYKLKKRFPNIRWVADYRDDWNTTELVKHGNLPAKLIAALESWSEKRWVGTASSITSISPHYVNKISSFTGIKGKVLLNGFSDDDMKQVQPSEKSDEFVITYTGTLYITQPFEIFLQGYKKAVDRYSSRIRFKLCFPGLDFNPPVAAKVREFMKGYEHVLKITERIPRKEVFEIQNRSHVFLMIAHEDAKGVSSSKLYEYLCFRKPVILCPNDRDIIEQTLEDTGAGIICNTSDEVFEKLSAMVESLLKNGKLSFQINENKLMKYARSKQVEELAKLLNTL